ncbi:MAG: hypothetical protein A2136_00695 [Chloroflexi bacterium RBG_16_54_11]|nr:MAG: hypothetical protein A2136_00695 [Chloroflexi bacterium RBG_16_54_11]
MRFCARTLLSVVLIACLGWLLAACGAISPTQVRSTLAPLPSLTATATLIPTVTPTPTPLPPTAVLLAAPGANQVMVDTLQTALNDIVTGRGLRWQVRQELAMDDLTPTLRLVVAVSPAPGLAELAAKAPETQFLAIGFQGLEPTPNLTLVGAAGDRPDRQGFIAGVIAAMLAPDWRTGVISLSDTVAGRSARTGFLNGVKYFCGLCRQLHPPYYEYPLYFELPLTASSAEWQGAANYMVDHYALAVYVFPGAGDESMLSILVAEGVTIISSGAPPANASSSWALSLSADPLALIRDLVAGLLDGAITGGKSLAVPIQFTQVNPELFTPGKQRLAGEILTNLQNDKIDTSVDLTTGENRP